LRLLDNVQVGMLVCVRTAFVRPMGIHLAKGLV
jgi:hypothetical protein